MIGQVIEKQVEKKLENRGFGEPTPGPQECYFPTPAFSVDSAARAPLNIVHRAP
jgi:hypothetical protein